MINILWGNEETIAEKSWFDQYGYIILIIVSAILVICACTALIIGLQVKKVENNKSKVADERKESYLLALGGSDNVLGVEAKGSRLIIKLKDFTKMDEDKLKSLGLDSSLKATDKITFIVGQEATEIASLLNRA